MTKPYTGTLIQIKSMNQAILSKNAFAILMASTTALFFHLLNKTCHASLILRHNLHAFNGRRHSTNNNFTRQYSSKNPPWTAIATIENESIDDEKDSIRISIESLCCNIDIKNETNEKPYWKRKIPSGNNYLLVHLDNTRQEYNLSSPREWLEYSEIINNSYGAYTVIRCDLFHPRKDDSSWNDTMMEHKIWGKEFHLSRIEDSFKQMFNLSHNNNEEFLNEASNKSERIIDGLIQEALQSFDIVNCDNDPNVGEVKTLMLTLLWTPTYNSNDIGKGNVIDIYVQGHVFCSNVWMDPTTYNPNPISASIALPLFPYCEDDEEQKSFSFPSRFDNTPTAKSSSWCRIRRSIESQYKTQGIGEVLLTRQICDTHKDLTSIHTIIDSNEDSCFTVLEGLTSNLFVVYKDGTIHTCALEKNNNGGVLDGYGRLLVLEAAKKCNIPVVVGPIDINDGKNGLWAEIFVTSSIRLISPVNHLLVPVSDMFDDDENVKLKDFWSEASIETLPWCTRRWKELYNSIIEAHN